MKTMTQQSRLIFRSAALLIGAVALILSCSGAVAAAGDGAAAQAELVLARFQDWQSRLAAATDPARKSGLLAEGVALARDRRGLMKQWIITDPERALASAVRDSARASLPHDVALQLEEQLRGRADIRVRPARSGTPSASRRRAEAAIEFSSVRSKVCAPVRANSITCAKTPHSRSRAATATPIAPEAPNTAAFPPVGKEESVRGRSMAAAASKMVTAPRRLAAAEYATTDPCVACSIRICVCVCVWV